MERNNDGGAESKSNSFGRNANLNKFVQWKTIPFNCRLRKKIQTNQKKKSTESNLCKIDFFDTIVSIFVICLLSIFSEMKLKLRHRKRKKEFQKERKM